MKVDKSISKKLASLAEVMSVIHGGTIFPSLKSTKLNDHYRVEVDAPSIDPDHLKIELNGNHLFIFQQFLNRGLMLPNLLGMVKLDNTIDVENIRADYEDQHLIVTIPFNEFSSGFSRGIDIDIH